MGTPAAGSRSFAPGWPGSITLHATSLTPHDTGRMPPPRSASGQSGIRPCGSCACDRFSPESLEDLDRVSPATRPWTSSIRGGGAEASSTAAAIKALSRRRDGDDRWTSSLPDSRRHGLMYWAQALRRWAVQSARVVRYGVPPTIPSRKPGATTPAIADGTGCGCRTGTDRLDGQVLTCWQLPAMTGDSRRTGTRDTPKPSNASRHRGTQAGSPGTGSWGTGPCGGNRRRRRADSQHAAAVQSMPARAATYSTVTDLARFLGWSTLQPRATAT